MKFTFAKLKLMRASLAAGNSDEQALADAELSLADILDIFEDLTMKVNALIAEHPVRVRDDWLHDLGLDE